METAFGILVLIGVYLLWQWLSHQLDEWGGAYGRWRRGEPLRASDLRLLQWKAGRERLAARKAELRRRHDLNPHLILDAAFRREFEDLGIGREIHAEVIAASGRQCAGCGRTFAMKLRKPLLAVDHIQPRKHYPHLLYVRSNLQVLCRPCNSHKSAYDGTDWKDVVATRRRATNKRRRAARAAQDLDQ